jgi:hypothetical protein
VIGKKPIFYPAFLGLKKTDFFPCFFAGFAALWSEIANIFLGHLLLNDNAITYNENVDRSNYIPIELSSQQDELPPDQDFHSSYRRLVPRTVKSNPHYLYLADNTPIFEYHSTDFPQLEEATTTSAPKIEECFANAKLLPRSIIKKMNRRRRKLAQSIRRLNKLQRTYCLTLNRRPKHQKSQKWVFWLCVKIGVSQS